MIKTSLKMLTLTALFAVFGLPTFAQDMAEGFSASVSGKILVDFDKDTAKESAANMAFSKESGKIAVVNASFPNSYAQINLNYKTATGSASSFIRFQNNGEKRINFSGSTTDGDWTGSGKLEYDEYFNSNYENTKTAIDQRDAYVSLTNGTMTFTMGNKQYFDAGIKWNDYLFNYHYKDAASAGGYIDVGATIDNRIEAFKFDFTISDGMTVGVLYGLGTDKGVFGGTSIKTNAIPQTQTTTMGLFFSADMADLGLGVHFEYGSSEEKGVKQNAGDVINDQNSKNATVMALGVSYKMDAISIGFNFKNQTETSKVLGNATGDVAIENTTGAGNTYISLNLGFAIDEDSGVGFSYSSKKHDKEKHKVGSREVEELTAAESTTMELGYQTKIAGVTVKASYITADFKKASGVTTAGGIPTANVANEAGSLQKIKVRMQYSF